MRLTLTWAIGIAAVGGLAVHAAGQIGRALTNGGATSGTRFAAAANSTAQASFKVEHKVLADEWHERLTTDSTWRNQRVGRAPSSPSSAPSTRSNSRSAPSRLQRPPVQPSWFAAPTSSPWWAEPARQPVPRAAQEPRATPRQLTGYRTVCVRLCDGYFFPISYAVSEGSFGRDQSACSNSCPGARLYHQRLGSDDGDSMVDMSGQSYAKLKTANLFRTEYVEGCKCKPNPWEQAAVDRHRVYALEEQRRKGNRAVVAELEELKNRRLAEARAADGRNRQAGRRGRPSEVAALAPAPPESELPSAPRSDVSRGQGSGELIPSMTGTAFTVPTPAPMVVAAAGTGLAAGSAAGKPADRVPEPAAQPPASRASTAAAIDASAIRDDPNGRQATPPASRPGNLMRLGAVGPQRAPEPRRAEVPRPAGRTAEWVNKVFNP